MILQKERMRRNGSKTILFKNCIHLLLKQDEAMQDIGIEEFKEQKKKTKNK